MKRFWKVVSVDAERVVRLDERPVRTPGRVPLALPTDALAGAVADEWRAVGATIEPRAMPLTGLANAAIDRIAPDPAAFAANLARYGESDLLCYRAVSPEPLVARQAATWNPILAWAPRALRRAFHGGHRHHPPAPATRDARPPGRGGCRARSVRTGRAVADRDDHRLADPRARALFERAVAQDEIWAASQLDEDWQAERWGADPLAEAARDERRAQFDAAVQISRDAATFWGLTAQPADEPDQSRLP